MINIPHHLVSPSAVTGNQNTNACLHCHTRAVCPVASFNDSETDNLPDVLGRRSRMARGDCLYMSGDQIQALYVLRSGSVKTYVNSMDGDHQITGFHFAGGLIGLHGIKGYAHSDTAEALEIISICEIPFGAFEELLTTSSNLRKSILRFIFSEMSHEQNMLLVLGKMSAARRVAYFLLSISKSMGKHGLALDRFNLTMTRHDVGDYLGLAVETVSRVLTRFQARGIIKVVRRSIVILNMDALEEIFENSIKITTLKCG